MSELVHLQKQFQSFLIHSDDAIQQNIIGTKKVSIETRLAIYANAYRLRLCDALAVTYPILKEYVGDEAFEELSLAYINQYPSCYRSIRWFGDQLAMFINQHPQYCQYPYLSELAQVEWTMTMVFDAADAASLSIADIGAIPPDAWEDMRFQMHPSILRLQLKWNVIAIWQALSDKQTPVEPKESATAVTWIFWRNNLEDQFCQLSEEEALAIDMILSGATFGELCEKLCEWIEEENAPMHAASFLKSWISAGLIIKLI